MLGAGRSILESIQDQGMTLKGARKKVLDLANTLGLSNTVMRMIERRSTQDKYILIAGMLIVLLCLYLALRYLWRLMGDVRTCSDMLGFVCLHFHLCRSELWEIYSGVCLLISKAPSMRVDKSRWDMFWHARICLFTFPSVLFWNMRKNLLWGSVNDIESSKNNYEGQ